MTMLLASTLAATAWSAENHEDGLFVRLSGGAGYGLVSVDESEKLELYGITTEFNIAVGAIIKPNLILHGTLWGWSPIHTEARFASNTLGGSHDVEVVAFGPGATYYFMPANLYLSFSIGFATLDAKVEAPDGSILRDSARGFALDFTVGKEWWKSDNWGVGVAGDFGYLNIENSLPGAKEVWTGGQLGLRLTATYN
jgi:hypothetical protein